MLRVGDIVLIKPIYEDDLDFDWFEEQEAWGSFGEVVEIDEQSNHPYTVFYAPWNSEWSTCSEEFSREELTHIYKLNVR